MNYRLCIIEKQLLLESVTIVTFRLNFGSWKLAIYKGRGSAARVHLPIRLPTRWIGNFIRVGRKSG